MESDYLLNRINSSYLNNYQSNNYQSNNNYQSQLSTQYSRNRMINDKGIWRYLVLDKKYEYVKQSNYQRSRSIQNTNSNTNRSFLNDGRQDTVIGNMNMNVNTKMDFKNQQKQQKLETKINHINNTDNLKKHLAQIINKSPISRSPINRDNNTNSRDCSPINFNNMKQSSNLQLNSNTRLNSQTNFMKLSNQMKSSGITSNNNMKGSLFDNFGSNQPLKTLLNDSSGFSFKSQLLRN